MSIHAIYRIAIWLPLIVPAMVVIAVNTLRVHPPFIFEIVAYSLIYGGIPYFLLAAWATMWVGGREESEIRRLMFRAPLVMVALFVPIALVTGLIVDAVRPFTAVAVLGSVIIVPLGYGYVGLAVLLRQWLGPRVT